MFIGFGDLQTIPLFYRSQRHSEKSRHPTWVSPWAGEQWVKLHKGCDLGLCWTALLVTKSIFPQASAPANLPTVWPFWLRIVTQITSKPLCPYTLSSPWVDALRNVIPFWSYLD